MGDGSHVDLAQQRRDGGGVDDRRNQELVGHAVVGSRPGRILEVAAGALEQHLAGERVAVRPQTGRGETDQHVVALDVLTGDEPISLDHTHREADEIELPRVHRAGVLGHLAADERAPGLPAPEGHPFDELLDVVGIELPHRDVVEEEQRFGALTDDVVHAHRDQVHADRVEATGGLGDEGLGADPVGAADQHGVGVAVLGEREQPAEPADVADDLGAEGGAHLRLDPLDRGLAGRDADPCVLVARAHDAGLVDRRLHGRAGRGDDRLLEDVLAQA